MGFGVVEEKEIPEYSTNDANKVLKVDSSGLYLQWLQETVAPAELPSQPGNSGRFLSTNGSVPAWSTISQVPGQTAGNNGQFLTSNGSSSSWASVSQVPSQSSQSGRFLTTNGTAASWAAISQVPSTSGNDNRVLAVASGGNVTWTNNLTVTSSLVTVPHLQVSTGTAASNGIFTSGGTNSGIRWQSGSNVRILSNGTTVIDFSNTSSDPLCSIEEAIVMKKSVRQLVNTVTSSFSLALDSASIHRINLTGAANDVTITLNERANGTRCTFIPYRTAPTTRKTFLTASSTVFIQIMHNQTNTQIISPNTYEMFEGAVYHCIYVASALTWYVWISGLVANISDPFVIGTTIDFQAASSGARIQGSNNGANSSIILICNSTTSCNFTVNDTEVQNSLRLFKAPITDWIIVDSTTHEVSRNSPSKIILTRGTTGSLNATVIFPISTNVPDGLTIQVMVWMLPDRTGTGTQRVRFDSTSPTNNAFVLGSSGTGIALGGTTYTVTEGTNFTATNFRTTIGRWMVDATRFNSTPALTAA